MRVSFEIPVRIEEQTNPNAQSLEVMVNSTSDNGKTRDRCASPVLGNVTKDSFQIKL